MPPRSSKRDARIGGVVAAAAHVATARSPRPRPPPWPIVGERVLVHWEQEHKWYSGRITSVDKPRGCFMVKYEDGSNWEHVQSPDHPEFFNWQRVQNVRSDRRARTTKATAKGTAKRTTKALLKRGSATGWKRGSATGRKRGSATGRKRGQEVPRAVCGKRTSRSSSASRREECQASKEPAQEGAQAPKRRRVALPPPAVVVAERLGTKGFKPYRGRVGDKYQVVSMPQLRLRAAADDEGADDRQSAHDEGQARERAESQIRMILASSRAAGFPTAGAAAAAAADARRHMAEARRQARRAKAAALVLEPRALGRRTRSLRCQGGCGFSLPSTHASGVCSICSAVYAHRKRRSSQTGRRVAAGRPAPRCTDQLSTPSLPSSSAASVSASPSLAAARWSPGAPPPLLLGDSDHEDSSGGGCGSGGESSGEVCVGGGRSKRHSRFA